MGSTISGPDNVVTLANVVSLAEQKDGTLILVLSDVAINAKVNVGDAVTYQATDQKYGDALFDVVQRVRGTITVRARPVA